MRIEEILFPTNDRRKFVVDLTIETAELADREDMSNYDFETLHKVGFTIRTTGDVGLVEFFEGPLRLMDAIMDTEGFPERLISGLTSASGMVNLRLEEW